MIERYTVKEIDKIWSEDNKLDMWLLVELCVVEAWSKKGVVPVEDLKKVLAKSKVNRKRMLELEEITKHDVVAFTRMVSESLGDEKKWIHLGLTSTDVVDTAQNKMIQQSNEIIESDLNNLLNTLKELALQNKDTLIMGRTHGIFGEPTSLGLKFLLWFEEIKRQIERFKLARKQIEVTKISGSMGNYANVDLDIEEFVAKKMNLNVDNLSTQVTQRDRHAFLISVFGNIASTLEKIAVEIRLFQRSEVRELLEGFAKNQKGSSSMPHKKNPISSENISGLSRYIKSFVNMAYENNVLWHERDISHSSNERIMFPDIFNTLSYSLKRLNNTLSNIVINYPIIESNIKNQNNIYFSQRVLTHIIQNYNFSRENIYDFIQECTLFCQANNADFKQVLKDKGINKFIKDEMEFENLFANQYFLRNVDKIYNRAIKE